MKRTAMQHTKLKRLVRVLRVPQYAAVGILESLWHLTAREAPMGNIGKLSNDDIAAWIDWEGDSNVLIAGLVSCGWLDDNEEHRIVVHDWTEHADEATKKAMSRQKPPVSGNVQTKPDKTRLPLPLPLPEPEPEPEPVQKQKQKKPQAAFVLPEWVDRKAWDGFEALRKRGGKRMELDDSSRALCIHKLESLKRAGHDPTEVLNQSVMNGYQGLFEVKGDGNGTGKRHFEPGISQTTEEIPADVVAELREKIGASRGIPSRSSG